MATENEKIDAQPDIMSLAYWCVPEFLLIAELSDAKIRGFEWKNYDVVVVTIPRSGTHLTWMITRMLVQCSAEPILDPMEDSNVWLPSFKDSQIGRRVLNTHIGIREVEESVFKEGNRKFIYVSRNCKDVSVSQFTFFEKFRVYSKAVLPDIWEDYIPVL